MTPLQYAAEIVLPTVRDSLAHRGDQRRAYVACIVTYHLRDYLARVHRAPEEKDSIALKRVDETMSSLCKNMYSLVRGISNGTKHAGNRDGYKFEPGSEMAHDVMAYGVSGGYGVAGRYGGFPGLSVDIEGHTIFIDFATQVVLLSFKALYPDDLGRLDLSFCDAATEPPAESVANALIVHRDGVP